MIAIGNYNASADTSTAYWLYSPVTSCTAAPAPRHEEWAALRAKRLACRRGWRERGVCRVARAGLPSRETRRETQRRGR
jgi:hypothetical protein